MIKNKLIEAMNFRHAAKTFSNKKISQEDINLILESGRLSPSSFGVEHWKFLVITNQNLKDKITSIAYNQKQVSESSHLIIYLAKIKDIKSNSKYVKELYESRMPKEIFQKVFETYNNFTSHFNEESLKNWSQKQTYIAAANMMTMAAYLGIDSCPMEGFNETELLKLLNINSEEYRTSLIIPFGYRNKDPREKTRLDINEVVEFIE